MPVTNNFELLYCFSNEIVFSEKFNTKVELIYGRLLPWYQDNDMVMFPLCFEHELLMSLRNSFKILNFICFKFRFRWACVSCCDSFAVFHGSISDHNAQHHTVR